MQGRVYVETAPVSLRRSRSLCYRRAALIRRVSLSYKGYKYNCYYDKKDSIWWGEIKGISDFVSFHSETYKELKKQFRKAVDNYLILCEKTGKLPEKPCDTGM